jgi:5-methylthioribose kinase
MTFNFSAYLSKIDPTQTYAIKQLTDGVVNFTVRATKKASTASSQGLFPLHASLVLKQAPPYVAGVGESAPMSQFRQVSKPYISSNRAC